MTEVAIQVSLPLVGQRIKRKEDLRLIIGKGHYLDDLKLPGMHYVALLRSPYAHAKIKSMDVSKAMSHRGVVAVVTGKDVVELSNPMVPAPSIPVKPYCMAVDKVRFVGEPVAAVVAKDRYTAEDAIEEIEVEYEPIQHVHTIEEPIAPDSSIEHEEVGTNLAWGKK